MVEMPPVDVGATFQLETGEFRVNNIWIDEDGVSHLSLDGMDNDREVSIDYGDLCRILEESDAERTNDGHDAWKWRNR